MTKNNNPESKFRKELHKLRMSSGTHNYFIDIKEAANGSKYLVVDQKKRVKVNGKFEGVKMRIFEDELIEFQRIIQKAINIVLNYNETSETVESQLKYAQKEHADSQISFDSELYPVFFNKLLSTHDWDKFEEYTFYLLKLLGIQNAYKFLGERQAGKADGFFKFGNLAVLYDCTLDNTNIEEMKKEQIINYCNRLQQGSIELSDNMTEEFHNFKKQVWIITKGESRRIKTVNDIAIKEIAIKDIMNIYKERLKKAISDEQLELKLGSF